MSRSLLGRVLAALGALLVIAGVVLMLAVVPAIKKLPSDTNVTRTYEGSMKVLLNPATMTFAHDVPVLLSRHFAVVKTDGNVALVREEKSLTSGGQMLEQVVNSYAIDRKTILGAPIPSSFNGAPGLFPRLGVVLSWPIGTKKQDITGWSDDYRGTVTLKFAGEVTNPRSHTKTYLFTSESGPKAIAAAEVARLGLPQQLPKQTLGGLIGASGMSPLVVKMLPTLLGQIPGASVPLGYTYEYEGKYWVDPTTGVLVDTEKHELRKVGLPDAVLAKTVLGALPEAQKAALRVTVSDLTYRATDKSVADAAKEAKDQGGRIRLYGSLLPWIGIVVGLVLLAGGVVVMGVRRG